MSTDQAAASAAAPQVPAPAAPQPPPVVLHSRLADVIDSFLMRMEGLTNCAKTVIPYAEHLQGRTSADIVTEMQAASEGLNRAEDRHESFVRFLEFQSVGRRMVVNNSADHALVLGESLLISAFSSFETFIAEFLRTLYRNRRHHARRIEKQVGFSDIEQCESTDEVLGIIIEREIDALLRESYDDAFESLARRFELKTLKEFPNWARFIECTQRRNLVTHCNGAVNSQYLAVCRRAGVQLGNDVRVGKSLYVTLDYLNTALLLLCEVGFKLGQTLWRKGCPDLLKQADAHLNKIIYELLKREEWGLARTIGEFGMLPINRKEKETDAVTLLVREINYAQALRWGGDRAAMEGVLSGRDWGATVRDFRLAVSVLRDEYDKAKSLMLTIGTRGEFIEKHSYADWPLFREFRNTSEFADGFRAVYGEEFQAEAGRIAREESEKATNAAKEHDGHDRQVTNGQG